MIFQSTGVDTYPARSSYADRSELYRTLYGVVMASDPDGQEEDTQIDPGREATGASPAFLLLPFNQIAH